MPTPLSPSSLVSKLVVLWATWWRKCIVVSEVEVPVEFEESIPGDPGSNG